MNTRFHRLIGVIGVIAAALIGVGVAFPFAAQPKLTWSPTGVYAGITSTTTVTKTVTFTSDQPLQNVTLEAVPEIARFVQIQPKTFVQIPAGQPQSVQLTFTALVGSQFGAYDATIHVRVGSSTLPQTLKTSVTFAVVPLPPDPSEAGKATIAGIDSDGDGVRDDIQRYIALSYPNSERTRAGLTQYAKVQETFLIQANNKTGAISAARTRDGAKACLYYILGVSDQSFRTTDELRARLLNTANRSRAYINANGLLGGEVFQLTPDDQRKAQCSFSPDGMGS